MHEEQPKVLDARQQKHRQQQVQQLVQHRQHRVSAQAPHRDGDGAHHGRAPVLVSALPAQNLVPRVRQLAAPIDGARAAGSAELSRAGRGGPP